jgi:hypothetical protein
MRAALVAGGSSPDEAPASKSPPAGNMTDGALVRALATMIPTHDDHRRSTS